MKIKRDIRIYSGTPTKETIIKYIDLCGTHFTRYERGGMKKEDMIVHDIILNPNTKDVNDTLIHELIHAALDDIQIDETLYGGKGTSLVKLAKKVNRNEEMVNKLSNYLSSHIKLLIEINSRTKTNDVSLDKSRIPSGS